MKSKALSLGLYRRYRSGRHSAIGPRIHLAAARFGAKGEQHSVVGQCRTGSAWQTRELMPLPLYVVAQPSQPVPTTPTLLFRARPWSTGSLPAPPVPGLRVLTADRSSPIRSCEKAGHGVPRCSVNALGLGHVPEASRMLKLR